MKPNKALKMLGFVPQPNLRYSAFLGKTYGVLGTDLIKLATKQAVALKFAQSVAFMQQARNLSVSIFYGHKIVPYRLGLTFLLVVGLGSCGNLTPSGLSGSNLKIGINVTPIREIKPEQNNQAMVYIQGNIQKQAPLMKQWAYEINDSTGKIWVVTNQKNLGEGSQVVIKGKVRYRSIPLAGRELGEVYLEEE